MQSDEERRREDEEMMEKVWDEIHNKEITPERRAKMEKEEEELFALEYLPPDARETVCVNFTCDKIMSDEEADQILTDSDTLGDQK